VVRSIELFLSRNFCMPGMDATTGTPSPSPAALPLFPPLAVAHSNLLLLVDFLSSALHHVGWRWDPSGSESRHVLGPADVALGRPSLRHLIRLPSPPRPHAGPAAKTTDKFLEFALCATGVLDDRVGQGEGGRERSSQARRAHAPSPRRVMTVGNLC